MQASDVIALSALIISGFALVVNYLLPKKAIHLSTQQTIINIVAERARQCNDLWEKYNGVPVVSAGPKPYFPVVSEVVMSLEIIEAQFAIFERNYKRIRLDSDQYHYLLWKQMSPDLREFLHHGAPEVVKQIKNDYYTAQVDRIHKDLHKFFEDRR